MGLLICKYPLSQIMICLPASDFSCFLLLAFFLCRPPFVALFPSKQPLYELQLSQVLGYFREGKYLADWSVGKVSRSWPAGFSAADRRGWMPAPAMCAFFLSHFSCGHRFATPVRCSVALRAAASDRRSFLVPTHYLSGYRKRHIVEGGEPPGRLVEPDARQNNEVTHSKA